MQVKSCKVLFLSWNSSPTQDECFYVNRVTRMSMQALIYVKFENNGSDIFNLLDSLGTIQIPSKEKKVEI
ncbi:hypothetical protein QQP08_003394 [Theobroma cacao]|nr:hypothetical protein QQP08_003394 [Theobroma cacao]